MTRPCLALILALAAPAVVRAQVATPSATNIEGFTVAGRGSVSALPNRLEIDLEVSAASELTADAIVKYRDARARLEGAFKDLKLEDVTIEQRGLLVDRKGVAANPYYYEPMTNQRTRAEVQLSRRLVVNCASIREMDEEALLQMVARLLDVAQDAGGQVGAGNEGNPRYYNPYQQNTMSLVRFVLDDFDGLREQAYEKAIADARARARRLAKLSGVELGPIVAVREVSVPGEDPQQGAIVINPYGIPDGESEANRRDRLESPKFQEIPVRVELLVRFEVRPAARGGQAAGARRSEGP